jgi:putative ABC transport system permease protein
MLNDLKYRIRALFQRDAVERELHDELHFHVEREAAKLERAGLSRAEAERQARVAFGGVEQIKEVSRDGRGLSWLEAVWQDLRYALRALRRTPGFTLAVVVTLGLGIGANAAMFGIVDRLLLRDPVMIRDGDRAHRMYFARQSRGTEQINSYSQYTRYQDLVKWTRSFDVLAAFGNRTLAVGSGADARELPVGIVSASFLDLFDAPPHLGRYFNTTEDVTPRGAPVVVLAHGYWQRQYGGATDVLGKSLKIGPVDYTVIGVAPKGFVGVPDRRDPIAFIPITTYAGSAPVLGENYYLNYNWSWMEILGRRKPGITVAQADADLTQAYQRSWQAEIDVSRRPEEMQSAEVGRPRAMVGPVLSERGPNQSEVTKVAGWVVGVTGIVLLIACANVANLLLARAIGRRREIALRLALGVSRGRLARQLLTESMLLAGMGIIGGLAVAHYGDIVLRRLFMPDGELQSPLVDTRTLLFTVSVALFAGLITGLAPILQARRTDLNDALKASARQGGQHKSRTRTALVLVQGALCVVLLIGAGLFVRSLGQVRGIDLGFDVKPLVLLSPNLRGQQLKQPEIQALNQRLLTIARGQPGVASVSTVLTTPFWDTWTSRFFVDGIDSVSKLGEFTLQASTPEYFQTAGTRILRGRGFDATDVAGGPRVVVISKAMAAALWPGQDPLGQCIRFGDTPNVDCTTVIGIAQDIKQNSLTNDRGLHYYFPLAQFEAAQLAVNPNTTLTLSILARVNGEGSAYAETLRRQLQSAMPGEGYMTVETMSNIVGGQTRSWEVGSTMFMAFGGLALVLASIGLYSVIAYDVARRTQELGVRMALGARVNDVVGMVVRDGVRFALLGLAVGGVVAFLASPYLAPLLYNQPARDPLIFAVVAGVLLGIALLASAIPALRAARVNPGVALRAE